MRNLTVKDVLGKVKQSEVVIEKSECALGTVRLCWSICQDRWEVSFVRGFRSPHFEDVLSFHSWGQVGDAVEEYNVLVRGSTL